MNESILRRHSRNLDELRDEENLISGMAEMKDTQSFLLIMAGVDPEDTEEEVKSHE